VGSHAGLEEELLFTALESHLGKEGPLAVMRAEHKELETVLERIEDAETIGEAEAYVRQALTIARDHFHKEEVVLFRIAEQLLSEDTLLRLGAAWARARHVAIS